MPGLGSQARSAGMATVGEDVRRWRRRGPRSLVGDRLGTAHELAEFLAVQYPGRERVARRAPSQIGDGKLVIGSHDNQVAESAPAKHRALTDDAAVTELGAY